MLPLKGMMLKCRVILGSLLNCRVSLVGHGMSSGVTTVAGISWNENVG